VGAQTLRRDALRVLGGLRLVVLPSDAGRERGDNGRGHFHAPLRAQDAERFREVSGLGVPLLRGGVVEEGSRCEVADEGFDGVGADGFVTVGAGGAHGSIVPYRGECVGNRCPEIINSFASYNASRAGYYQAQTIQSSQMRAFVIVAAPKQPSPERIGAGTNPLRLKRAPPR